MSIHDGAAIAAPRGGAVPKAVSQKERARRIAQALKSYPRKTRPAVEAVAALHPRLADLALSFPVLLLALSVRRCGIDAQDIITRVITGEGLATLAASARLPLWTRKLKPEACRDSMPALPDGELFRRQIGSFLNRIKPENQYRFATCLSVAWRWHGDGFAAWVGRAMAEHPDRVRAGETRIIALWAWFSNRAGTLGFGLTEAQWHPGMSFEAASQAASGWLDALCMYFCVTRLRLQEPWMEEREVDGFQFVHIESVDELVAEAAAMRNCLRSFDNDVGANRMQVYGIRRGGRRVAVLSVKRTSWNPAPVLEELKGPCNEDAPKDVWAAAARWFFSHDLAKMTAHEPWTDLPDAPPQKLWEAMWKPYWQFRGFIPRPLPLVPEQNWTGPLWRS